MLVNLAGKGRAGPTKLLLGRPTLPQSLEFFWTAFQRLGSCRPFGPASMGPIPWDVMDRYATRFSLNEDEYDEFLHIMESLDQTYLVETTPKDTKKPK
jgi:hypothetical protein